MQANAARTTRAMAREFPFSPPALLVGNETQLSFATPPTAMPHKAGRLRAIAVTSDKRSAAVPELPTISEAGLPGFNVEGWLVCLRRPKRRLQ